MNIKYNPLSNKDGGAWESIGVALNDTDCFEMSQSPIIRLDLYVRIYHGDRYKWEEANKISMADIFDYFESHFKGSYFFHIHEMMFYITNRETLKQLRDEALEFKKQQQQSFKLK